MPRLIVEKGSEKGKAATLGRGGNIVVGRDPQAHLRINDTMCSRLQFRIEATADGFRVVDLESMNGTYINGERIKDPVPVRVGDTLQVGETLFSFLHDTDESDPLIGQKLGGYQILGRLGRGGMGVVYKAEQKDLQRVVALKVISDDHLRDKNFRDLFVNEARAAAQLNHPNVVPVYDIKKEAATGTYYFSMECMSGGSVQDLLGREKKLPVDSAVRMILDAARGLEYAERKGIVHRDIKPDNLMIGETGIVKLGDLGLARRATEEVRPEERDVVIGTPHYIAPEQVLGEKPDHRGDIYSLGATLYRMVGGRTPYTGNSVKEIVTRKVKSDPVPLTELDSAIPAGLDAIVHRMMERNPADRYPSVTEVIADLEGFLKGEGGAGAGETPVWRRTGVIVAALAGLFALLGVAVAVRMNRAPAGGESPNSSGTTNPPPGDPFGGTAGGNAGESIDALGRLLLAQAEDDQRKMDAAKSSSVRGVIASYRKVLDDAPKSASAPDARRRIEELEAALRAIDASAELARADPLDRDAFTAFSAGVTKGKMDASGLKGVLDAYGKISGAYPCTPPARDAEKRAAHIRTWLAAFEKMSPRFESVRDEARKKADAKAYREALDLLNGFEEECRRAAVPGSFRNDRYGDLLYDRWARAQGGAILEEANGAFAELKKTAEAHIAAGRFDEARAALQPVFETYRLPSLVQEAQSLQDAVQQRILARLREDERKEALARDRDLAEDQKSLAAAAERCAESVKRYEFTKAAEVYRAAEVRTPVGQRIRDRRVGLLGRLQGFFAAFQQRLKASTIPIKTDIGEGQIANVSAEGITVKIREGGDLLQLWGKFKPADLGAMIRRVWKTAETSKTSDPEKKPMDPDNLLSFALFHRALDQNADAATAASEGLAAIERERAEAQKSGNPASDRTAVEARLLRIVDEMKGPIGTLDQEDEAEIRFARAQELVRAREAAARSMVDALLSGPLASARFAADNADRIRRLDQELRKGP